MNDDDESSLWTVAGGGRRRLVSTGERVRVDPVNRVPGYDPRAGEHLWVITTAYRIDPQRWFSPDVSMATLNAENLLLVAGPGCFYCEEPYTPYLAKRRCRGEG